MSENKKMDVNQWFDELMNPSFETDDKSKKWFKNLNEWLDSLDNKNDKKDYKYLNYKKYDNGKCVESREKEIINGKVVKDLSTHADKSISNKENAVTNDKDGQYIIKLEEEIYNLRKENKSLSNSLEKIYEQYRTLLNDYEAIKNKGIEDKKCDKEIKNTEHTSKDKEEIDFSKLFDGLFGHSFDNFGVWF